MQGHALGAIRFRCHIGGETGGSKVSAVTFADALHVEQLRRDEFSDDHLHVTPALHNKQNTKPITIQEKGSDNYEDEDDEEAETESKKSKGTGNLAPSAKAAGKDSPAAALKATGKLSPMVAGRSKSREKDTKEEKVTTPKGGCPQGMSSISS